LRLEITDNGIGLPAQRHAGLGLVSMRERAEELSGTCIVEQNAVGGTRVIAHLPLLMSAVMARTEARSRMSNVDRRPQRAGA
jgi:nitrate/nitrite-specific signal transduction histidine kinase